MKLKRAPIAATLAAVAVLVGTQAAFATTTLSVDGAASPAGPVAVSMKNGTPGAPEYLGTFDFETEYLVAGTCKQATFEGYLLRGTSSTLGTKIGAITEAHSANCGITALDWIQNIYKKPGTSEWGIHLLEVPTPGQRYVNIFFRNVDLRMNSMGSKPWNCAAKLVGDVRGKFDTQLDRLILNTPTLAWPLSFPLYIDALNRFADETDSTTTTTCAGEIQDNDRVSLKGTFQLDRDIEF